MTNYIIESGIILTALYLLYYLFLRNETHFKFKRAFLVAAVLFSLIIPIIQLPAPLDFGVVSLNRLPVIYLNEISVQQNAGVTVGSSHLNMGQGFTINWVWIIYGSMSAGLLVVILYSLTQILRYYFKSTPLLFNNRVVRVHPSIVHSFSFFNIIFAHQVNPLIIAHEEAHGKLGHTYDILLINLTKILLWWTPATWMINRELKLIHEYQADAKASNNENIQDYRRLLISTSMASIGMDLASSFHDGAILKRLNAMKQQTKNISKWKISALGVLVAAIVVFSCGEQDLKEISENAAITTELSKTGEELLHDLQKNNPGVSFKVYDVHLADGEDMSDLKVKIANLHLDHEFVEAVNLDKEKGIHEIIVREGQKTEILSQLTKKEGDLYTVVDQKPEFPGGMKAFFYSIQENIKYPEAAKKAGVEGKVFVQFVVEKDGSISNIEVVRGVSPELDKVAVHALSLSPNFIPGKVEGENVRVKMVLPIAFSLGEDTK